MFLIFVLTNFVIYAGLEADDHDAVLLFTAWGVTVQTVMATSSSGLGSGGGADSARNGHGQKHRRQDGHKEAIERMEQQRRVAKGWYS
jgi:hypothetical protein